MAAVTVAVPDLEALVGAILAGAGFADDTAAVIAAHLVGAEARGVASHGVARLVPYLAAVREGELDPRARPRLVRSEGAVIEVDGGLGLGIAAMEFALDALMPVARNHGVAAAGIIECGHTGRVGAYAERGAREGFFVQCFGGGGRRKFPRVVPHGGVGPIMNTNPYALAAPAGDGDPVVADFATSAIAMGKVHVANARGCALPDGVAVDRDGGPTTSASLVGAGNGYLLPAAGPKGSGLGVVAELVAEAMMGRAYEHNWIMIALRADAFRPIEDYRRDALAFVDELHAVPPAPGFEKVLAPGEPEHIKALGAARDGIVLDDEVRSRVADAARSVGVAVDFPAK
ncbi:MAG: Ldh family oxidoreductase [Alphaproteobacteria bacterium]|nr:Ldh family oxidoreductase [Alphaproteobacteria bacterium]